MFVTVHQESQIFAAKPTDVTLAALDSPYHGSSQLRVVSSTLGNYWSKNRTACCKLSLVNWLAILKADVCEQAQGLHPTSCSA